MLKNNIPSSKQPEVAEVTEPEVSEAPEAPEVPEVPEILEVSEAAEAAEVPEVPEAPETLKTLETLEILETVDTLETRETVEHIEVPPVALEVAHGKDLSEESTELITIQSEPVVELEFKPLVHLSESSSELIVFELQFGSPKVATTIESTEPPQASESTPKTVAEIESGPPMAAHKIPLAVVDNKDSQNEREELVHAQSSPPVKEPPQLEQLPAVSLDEFKHPQTTSKEQERPSSPGRENINSTPSESVRPISPQEPKVELPAKEKKTVKILDPPKYKKESKLTKSAELEAPAPTKTSVEHHRSRSESNAKLATIAQQAKFQISMSSDQIRPNNTYQEIRSNLKPISTSSRPRTQTELAPVKQLDSKTEIPKNATPALVKPRSATTPIIPHKSKAAQTSQQADEKESNLAADQSASVPAPNEVVDVDKPASATESKPNIASPGDSKVAPQKPEANKQSSLSSKSSFLSWLKPKATPPVPKPGPKKVLDMKPASTERRKSIEPESTKPAPPPQTKEDPKYPRLPQYPTSASSPALLSRHQPEYPDPSLSPSLFRYWELPKHPTSPPTRARSSTISPPPKQEGHATDEEEPKNEQKQEQKESATPAKSQPQPTQITSYAKHWEPARHKSVAHSRSKSFVDPATLAAISSAEKQSLRSSSDILI